MAEMKGESDMSSVSTLMTTEEMLALPENGMERDLIRGELREKPVTVRNRFHSTAESKIVGFLTLWELQKTQSLGRICSGEAGCILQRNPDTTVGIDVAYFSAETVARQTDATTLFDGAPLLAVEILSPTDQMEEIEEKIDEYLAVGVPLVWIVNLKRRTVTVYRPDAKPQLFNDTQELSGDPHLLGLRVPVAMIFE